MVKKMFEANFEESQRIQKKYQKYIQGAYKNMGVFKILFISFLGAVFFGIMLYAQGIALPKGLPNAAPSEIHVVSPANMILAGKIASPLIIIPVITVFLWIISFIVLVILRFLPNWNVRTLSFWGAIQLLQMSGLLFFVYFPMLVGLAAVGSGIIGLIFQLITVLTYFIYSMKMMKRSLLRNLYGEKLEDKTNWKIIILFSLIFILLFLNSYFSKIGFITKEFDDYTMIYGWLLIIFGMGCTAILRFFIFKNFLCAYYFAKYSNQYRELWELTDEQWHGKGKARRIARKERRKNKKAEK